MFGPSKLVNKRNGIPSVRHWTDKAKLQELGKHFYDKRITPYSNMPPSTMSVRTMLEFWTSSDSALDHKLVNSANYLIKELPIRLSHRIVDFHNLPFVLACNPHLQKVYSIYLNSFDVLVCQKPITNVDQNLVFSDMLRQLFEAHTDVVPSLARALRESKDHSTPKHFAVLQQFLDSMLVKRISTRMIAGQHLSSMNLHPRDKQESFSLSEQSVIGLIEKHCRPAEVAERCAESAGKVCEDCYGITPEITIEGHTNITFAYVRVHLEYILFEILKNALRATVERYLQRQAEGERNAKLEPVVIVVSGSEDEISIKVSDKGGGVPSSKLSSIWSYGYSTAAPVSTGSTDDEENSIGNVQHKGKVDNNKPPPMHGFGFGLPLARIYAQYFGGDLQINSMVGYGTDVYLKIGRLGRHMENIQI